MGQWQGIILGELGGGDLFRRLRYLLKKNRCQENAYLAQIIIFCAPLAQKKLLIFSLPLAFAFGGTLPFPKFLDPPLGMKPVPSASSLELRNEISAWPGSNWLATIV